MKSCCSPACGQQGKQGAGHCQCLPAGQAKRWDRDKHVGRRIQAAATTRGNGSGTVTRVGTHRLQRLHGGL
jgi:hypothetical protein